MNSRDIIDLLQAENQRLQSKKARNIRTKGRSSIRSAGNKARNIRTKARAQLGVLGVLFEPNTHDLIRKTISESKVVESL